VQREELYQEVRTGVNLMTDLIDSLLEFARTRESLSPAYGNVLETIQRAVQGVRLHPRHHARLIEVLCGPQVAGWFDQRKLERVLYNLLLNACEAAPSVGGKVEVAAGEVAGAITVWVADNGPGVAESIRSRLFHPFVSFGKQNGTGLGLAVVQKIVQDHGGEIHVERTAQGMTVFRIVLPGRVPQSSPDEGETHTVNLVPVQPNNATQSSISHPGP
jgi:signal transduction histidine kinase